MNCPNCKTSNNTDSKFCIRCGRNLENIQSTENVNNFQKVGLSQPQTMNYQQPVQNTPTKKENKIILIVFAIIAIIGIGIFVYFKFLKNNIADLNIIFDPNKPIVVNNNGKYGYITSEGKTMIEPQYKWADDFYGNYAIVSIDNPDAASYNETLYQIIDKKGNVKLTSVSSSEPQYYPTYDIWEVDEVLYDSNFNRILSEGITVEYIDYQYFEYSDSVKNETGIINYKGKKIFTVPESFIYVDISENGYDEDELYAAVKTFSEPEKEVIISLKTGKVLFTNEDAETYNISEKDNGIFYYYNRKSTDGYENKKYLFFINNKLAYETTEVVDEVEVYDYKNQILKIDYGYDYETLGKSQRIYYYDVKNKKMLDQKPSSSNDLKLDLLEEIYGFKTYYNDGKYGLMSNENVILSCEYDDIEFLNLNIFNYMKSKGKELILLEKDKNIILYDLKSSKAITTFNSRYVYDYDDSTFIKISLTEDNSYKIYNLLSGKSMDFDKNNDISIGSNYVTVKKDGKTTYYNTNLKQIYVTIE